MFENLVEILKANPRKIVYTEGSDARILESAARLQKRRLPHPHPGGQCGGSEGRCRQGRL